MCSEALLGVLGEGSIRDALLAQPVPVRALSGDSLKEDVPGCQLVVTARDAWDSGDDSAIRDVCATNDVPWLPARASLGSVVVGPVERGSRPGCVECADVRRDRLVRSRKRHAELWRRQAAARRQRTEWLTSMAADTLAALITAELDAAESGRGGVLDRAVVTVDLRRLFVARHVFLPDPMCPVCGDAPEDSAAHAIVGLSSRAKPRPDIYRSPVIGPAAERLEATYVDAEVGLIHGLVPDSHGGLVTSMAPTGTRGPFGGEAGFGRGTSYPTSRIVAVLEALERYGGTHPGGRRTVVHGCYADLADEALDPRTVGSHSPEDYNRVDYPLQPFDERADCAWVWGYSFGRGRPVLLPQSLAYYGSLTENATSPPFVAEVSNGCAVGGNLEEAVLFGLLEVAERDAFLMTWYGRMALPRVDIDACRDRNVPLLAACIREHTGYDVHVYDATLEQRIPAVWAMAVNPADDGRAKVLCGAASHLLPEAALFKVLSELGPHLDQINRQFESNRARAEQMVREPELVNAMEDHMLLYACAAAYPRFRFLTETRTVLRPDQMRGATTPIRHADLRLDLEEVMQRYTRSGLDVLVVDQTTPEHELADLRCVKVVVPGTLPMTFGHHYRRTTGLPRLREIPHRLGFRHQPLAEADLNPHPHPFP